MKLTTYLAITTFFITCQSQAAVALQAVSLGGTQQTVSWEAGTLKRTDFTAGGATAPSTPTSGVGSIVPVAPGYRASFGYYSYTGNFGLTASTSIQSGAFSDIQSVVFQRVSMMNPGSEETPLTAYDNLVYAGGPQLTYTYVNELSQVVSATVEATFAAVGNGIFDDSSGFAGTYYNFSYQWDLSGVAGDITSVSITSPILVHSSTTEAQIDIGGSFNQVIPEPTSAALLGLGVATIALRRRRN